MDHKTLIDKLGGIGAVSTLTGASISSVGNWRMAKRGIPWKHRPAIARAAAERALELPQGFWTIAPEAGR